MVKSFNNWTISDEVERKNGKRRVICQCICGVIAERYLYDIKSGHSKSCGCLRDALASNRSKTHGDSKTRLYSCWCKMLNRASKRGSTCNIFVDWLNFESFKTWSLDNGYSETLQLCRNGDKGDYEPDNVRWDTLENNVIEAKAKSYTFKTPEGEKVEILNLSKFCRDKGLTVSGFHRVMKGQKSYKGYTLFN